MENDTLESQLASARSKIVSMRIAIHKLRCALAKQSDLAAWRMEIIKAKDEEIVLLKVRGTDND